MIMAIIGKINDKVLIDDLVFREEPEVLTRWQDPTIEEMKKEIERLKKENNDLRKIYQRTSEHLFDMGDAELARYFQAQIDECPTFYVEPIIDYYKEYNRLNNIINETIKDIEHSTLLLEEGPVKLKDTPFGKRILYKLKGMINNEK